jgi:glycosyltransferase involved in cell wall biosynthesis
MKQRFKQPQRSPADIQPAIPSDANHQRPIIQAVVYTNPDGYPPIINSARLLAQAGFRLDIFSHDAYRNVYRMIGAIQYPAHVQVHRLPADSRGTWQNYLRFVGRVLAYGNSSAALFVGHDMYGLLPATILAHRYRRPLIYHCHDFAESGRSVPLGSSVIRMIERRIAHRADLVIVPDAARAEVVAQELRLKRRPLVVANAPIHRFDGSGTALHQALAQQGKRFTRILFRQGSIGPGHALEATLQSLPHWNDPTWGFVIMGFGESDYLERLSDLAHTLGVEQHFAVLPRVRYDEIDQFIRGADAGHGLYEPVHINNIHIATASNKIMEYMAAGLPILVSDTPALRALVATHRCGMTADESNPMSIAATVNQLFANPDQMRSMSAAAVQAFEQEFCYERQFAPVLEHVQALINRYET